METTQSPIFSSTIDVHSLTFADWKNIASAIDQSCKWAYFKWVDSTNMDLSSLTIEDWEEIESVCEFNQGWSYHRYKENR